jgi:uncharacterized protein
LLMVGGAYLCFEGFEKLAHKYLHSPAEEAQHHQALTQALTHPEVDMVAFEKDKVSGAIRTDFVLSAEIIAITLGVVQSEPFMRQVAVVGGIAVLMTVGVYGIVAAIVKMDDAGLYLSRLKAQGVLMDLVRRFGLGLVSAAAPLMKLLAVVGTVAMFMVGGGIVTHGLPGTHAFNHHVQDLLAPVPALGPVLSSLAPAFIDVVGGVVVGAITVALWTLVQKVFKRN